MMVVCTPFVFAWKERLAECAAIGILPKDCPDDDSVLVPPTPPEQNNSNGHSHSSGTRSGSGNNGVWVLIADDGICYSAYYRYVDSNNGFKVDFPDRRVYACTYNRPLINVVSQ